MVLSFRFYGAALLTLLCVSGCAGRKLRTDLEKNVTLSSTLKNSSNTVNAALFVFSIDPKCNWEQTAQFKLEPGTLNLGLPVGEKLALEFVFSATSFFSPNRQVSYQTQFTAKERARYDIEASYNGGMYFVEVKERASGKAKVMERIDPNDCKPTP